MSNIDFVKISLEELISIVESPEDFVNGVPESASQELRRRKISKEEIEAIAIYLYHNECKDLFEGNLFPFEQFEMPFSSILNKEQKSAIFTKELRTFIDKRNALNSNLSLGQS